VVKRIDYPLRITDALNIYFFFHNPEARHARKR